MGENKSGRHGLRVEMGLGSERQNINSSINITYQLYSKVKLWQSFTPALKETYTAEKIQSKQTICHLISPERIWGC